MPSLTRTRSVSSWLASLHKVVMQCLTLAAIEGKHAGRRLMLTLVLALLAAGMAIIGCFGLLAGFVYAIVQNNVVSWGAALSIASLLSFAGAGGLALVAIRSHPRSIFAATWRQLGAPGSERIEVDAGFAPIAPYEQAVVDARIAAGNEYRVLRNGLSRRLDTLLIVGGSMLAVLAVGCFVLGRHQLKGRLESGRPSAWLQILGSVQVLTPLLIALRFATRSPMSRAPSSALQPDGTEEVRMKRCHGS